MNSDLTLLWEVVSKTTNESYDQRQPGGPRVARALTTIHLQPVQPPMLSDGKPDPAHPNAVAWEAAAQGSLQLNNVTAAVAQRLSMGAQVYLTLAAAPSAS